MPKTDLPDSCKSIALKQTILIMNSYKHWLGKELLQAAEEERERVAQLYEAPFVVVSATAQVPPILNYGNRMALKLWEMDWHTLTKTPGHETAEAQEREERQKFLRTVEEKGYIENYTGIRISSTGRRFLIEEATVWNLIDEKGCYCGQAATFSKWKNLY